MKWGSTFPKTETNWKGQNDTDGLLSVTRGLAGKLPSTYYGKKIPCCVPLGTTDLKIKVESRNVPWRPQHPSLRRSPLHRNSGWNRTTTSRCRWGQRTEAGGHWTPLPSPRWRCPAPAEWPRRLESSPPAPLPFATKTLVFLPSSSTRCQADCRQPVRKHTTQTCTADADPPLSLEGKLRCWEGGLR